jgi:hypothetical protein
MPSCVIEAISADRLPWLMSSAPPIDVAGSDTVSSSQANSAMTRTQREAKKVCVEREDDMLGKLISRRPPRSTRFCPAPDGCKATGHISPYFFDSFRFALDVDGNCALHARPSAIRSTMSAWGHHPSPWPPRPCTLSGFGVPLQQPSHGRLKLLQAIGSPVDSFSSDRFFQHDALLGNVFFTEHQ